MHLTPAMVDDLMAIEPLAAHDLLNGLKQELPGLPVGRRHVPGAQRTDEGATKLAMGRSGASIGAPGAMLNATCRLVVRQRSHGYGPVDPGSADRWRNAQVSRKYAPFVLARRAAQISKNFGRKSGPPKFR